MTSEEKPNMDGFGFTLAVGALKALAFLYDIITFPVYVLIQRPWQKRALSKRVKAVPIMSDCTSITYRSVDKPKETHVSLVRNNIDTLDKVMRYVAKIHSTRRCLGTRKVLSEEDEVQPNGKVFKKYSMGDYSWKNYSEVDSLSTSFGQGIRKLGQKSKENVVIFAETRAEWMLGAQGLFKQNMPLVTIYATLGDDAITHGINETEVSIVITSHDLLPKFRNILQKAPKVSIIIYMEDQLKETDLSGYKEGVRLISFSEVIKLGAGERIAVEHPPKAEDTAIIMYTSGSTGTPKGVTLSHKNILTCMKTYCDAVTILPTDVMIGFLPLAHVFELLAESVCLLAGVPIGYSSAQTMIDASTKIKKGGKGDVSVLHPTIMTSVPLILDRITKGINDKVSKQSTFARVLFKFAVDYRSTWVNRGYDTPILNATLFEKVRGVVGGKMRLVLAGGAPLSPDTHEQIKTCLCVNLVQGYGLTETCSCAAVLNENDLSYGRVGGPTTCCDIKLVNWDEGGYRVSDKPFPRGEIIIGGDNVSEGYYKMPGKTAEDFFDEDGKRWFRSGDIGEIHADGVLKITDRKKDLVKLQQGEYVSLGKVETELKTCPVVENICVYGDPTKHYTVALVVPNPTQLKDIGLKQGIDLPFEELCSSPDLEKAVVKELADHGKKCKLERFEVPAAVTLCTDVWSPETGLVTAAFKLKRKDIQTRYQKDINRMYCS